MFCGAEVTQADCQMCTLARWYLIHRRHLPTARPPIPREEENTPCRHPTGRSGGLRPPRQLPQQCRLFQPRLSQHRKQRALLMYLSLCGFWSKPHPTFEPAQAARVTGNGQGSIHSHIVFIQRCCFAQIIMNFFTGKGHGIGLFCRASLGACKTNLST